jgi:hypothetical protein
VDDEKESSTGRIQSHMGDSSSTKLPLVGGVNSAKVGGRQSKWKPGKPKGV